MFPEQITMRLIAAVLVSSFIICAKAGYKEQRA